MTESQRGEMQSPRRRPAALPRSAAIFLACFLLTWLLLGFAEVFAYHRYVFGIVLTGTNAGEPRSLFLGTNVEGYRGRLLPPRLPNELRAQFLGGSPGFGWGVLESQTIPAQLELMLASKLDRPFSIANLAEDGDSSVCYSSTLEHYRYLDASITIIYEGANDANPAAYYRDATTCARDRYPLFRLTGYVPILPVVIRDSYYKLRYGSVQKGYDEDAPAPIPPDQSPSEAVQNQMFASRIDAVVSSELAANHLVAVVTELPFNAPERRRQQAALAKNLGQFGSSPRFQYIGPGTGDAAYDALYQAVTCDRGDPCNSEFDIDGVHLTAEGSQRMAQALVDPLAALIQRNGMTPRTGPTQPIFELAESVRARLNRLLVRAV